MNTAMSNTESRISLLNKVPEITIVFWVIKIMSTTVGETGADYLAVHVGLGANVTAAIMVTFLIAALIWQLRSPRYVPWIYWLTVVLVSVVGTQITDFLTDKLEISLYVSTAAFFAILLALTFAVWYAVERTLSIHTIVTTRRELFYWAAILFTFALGTAAGDLATEALSLGFNVGVLAFGALIGLIAAAYYLGANAVLDLLARLHPDPAARRLARRSPVPVARIRRAWSRNHLHEPRLSHRHCRPCRRRELRFDRSQARTARRSRKRRSRHFGPQTQGVPDIALFTNMKEATMSMFRLERENSLSRSSASRSSLAAAAPHRPDDDRIRRRSGDGFEAGRSFVLSRHRRRYRSPGRQGRPRGRQDPHQGSRSVVGRCGSGPEAARAGGLACGGQGHRQGARGAPRRQARRGLVQAVACGLAQRSWTRWPERPERGQADPMRALLAEDDRMIGEAVVNALKDASYAVDWVRDGDAACDALDSHAYDIVLLDLGLPRKDGLAVLRSTRSSGNAAPVLVITARDAIDDRIVGLDTGADDYIVKPFDMGELLARMRAVDPAKGGSLRPDPFQWPAFP